MSASRSTCAELDCGAPTNAAQHTIVHRVIVLELVESRIASRDPRLCGAVRAMYRRMRGILARAVAGGQAATSVLTITAWRTVRWFTGAVGGAVCRPPRGAAGRASVRHAARAGGDAAGVAEEAARHVPAGADAQARHRHVGRADARVQRGPGLHGDHRARDVRGAPADDLRLLRHVRRGRHGAVRVVRRADRARRHVAGRRVRGAARRRSRPPATSDAASRRSSGATSSGRC